MQDKENKEQKTRQQVNSYMKYSGMAIQMGGIILIGILAGKKLDQYLEMEPILTVVFALLSIFAALYVTLKDFL